MKKTSLFIFVLLITSSVFSATLPAPSYFKGEAVTETQINFTWKDNSSTEEIRNFLHER